MTAGGILMGCIFVVGHKTNNGEQLPDMKHALIALFVFINPLNISAQTHYLYADGGLSLAYFDPGFSATYNYNITRHIGIGAGAQLYAFHTTVTAPRQFTPALFADFRFRIRPRHISQYFILADLGMDFYKHNNDYSRSGNYVYTAPNDNGVYFGLGIGYFHRYTRRGWGPYASLKMITDFHKETELHITTGDQKSQSVGRGTLVVSLGFRFGNNAIMPPAKEEKARNEHSVH